jgi:uncharacterized protein
MSGERSGFVFDTNVLVSAALLPTSIPSRSLRAARLTGVLLLSGDTLREIESVLARSKFDLYLDERLRFEFLELLKRASTMVEIVERIAACRDPRDDQFLEVAVNGRAAWIVTGDSDLLSLDPFRDIRIVTPAQMLEDQSATGVR